MSTRTLLERLESPGRGLAVVEPGELLSSIRHHLQRMLNTRKGNAPAVPDFGTSDFSELLRGGQSIQVFCREIQTCIESYEPRLREVAVTFVPTEVHSLHLHFEVEALVVTEDGEASAVFRTVMDGSGAMKIE